MSIQLQDISVVFQQGAASTHALKHVDLTIEDAEYVTIIGPNGAGKSTLVNTIAGSLMPTKGRVLLDGDDVTGLPDHRRARWIARVFQDPSKGTCEGLSVIENAAIAMRRGKHRSWWARGFRQADKQQFGQLLSEYGRDLEHKLDEDVARLSGGQRQLLSMIMAVAADPSVLLLDEHTSALDPEIGSFLMERTDEIIRARRLTTVMVTHNMRLAAMYGDRLLVMSGGRIVDDIAGEEKAALDEASLIERFRTVAAAEVTDRMVG